MADLGDILAGAAGAPVNRPALNAYVTQGQAMAGLRSAQTEDALARADQAQEEMEAHSRLGDSLTALFKSQGDPAAEQKGNAARDMLVGHFGTSKDAFDALQVFQNMGFQNKVADPNANPNVRFGADAALRPGANPTMDVGNQIVPRFSANNQTQPLPVQQTPMSTSIENKNNADATHLSQDNNVPPDAQDAIAEFIRQNPNLAGNLRSLVSRGGWGVAYDLATGHPYGVQPGYGGAAHPGAPGAGPQTQATGTTPPPGGAAPPAPGAVPGANSPGAAAAPALYQPAHPGPNGLAPEPGVDLQEQAQIRSDFAHGLARRQVGSLNTMINHAALFDAIADQLNNHNFTPTNYITNLWKRTFGSPVPSNLQLTAGFLGREAVRATVNSGAGTGQERELTGVSNTSGPDVLHGAAATLRTLAGGQLNTLALDAKRGGVDIRQLLSPEAQAAYGMEGGAPPPAPTGGGASSANTVQTLDAYLKSKGY